MAADGGGGRGLPRNFCKIKNCTKRGFALGKTTNAQTSLRREGRPDIAPWDISLKLGAKLTGDSSISRQLRSSVPLSVKISDSD